MKKEHLLTLAVLVTTIAWLTGAYYFISFKQPVPAMQFDLKEEKLSQSEATNQITVHLAGAVKKPGVYRLPTGSRLVSAIDTAGGACENSDLNALNLAKVLADGEKVLVPASAVETKAKTVAEHPSARTFSPSEKINLNTADSSELEGLPGIGPALARRILEYRQKNGPFAEVNDLRKVAGIGEKKFEKIKEAICCY